MATNQKKQCKQSPVIGMQSPPVLLDYPKELEAIERVTQRYCKSKQTARSFLIKSGLLTKSGKLSSRYK